MKYFAAVLLLALFAIAMAAEKTSDPKKVEDQTLDTARDKRGAYLGGYSPYSYVHSPYAYGYSPYAYSDYGYGLPYTYAHPYYRHSYPYYHSHY